MEDTQDLSAHVTKLQENVLRWEDRLRTESGGPDAFRQAMGELRASLDAIGRAGFLRLAQAGEVAAETLVGEARIYRFKQVVDKEWMTRYCQMLWMARERIRRFQAASFISPSMNGTPSMTWVMSL